MSFARGPEVNFNLKDYLNNTERMSLIGALKIADMLEEITEGNLFTKAEKSNIDEYMVK